MGGACEVPGCQPTLAPPGTLPPPDELVTSLLGEPPDGQARDCPHRSTPTPMSWGLWGLCEQDQPMPGDRGPLGPGQEGGHLGELEEVGAGERRGPGI